MNITDHADHMTALTTGFDPDGESYEVRDETTGLTYEVRCINGQWQVSTIRQRVDEDTDLWAAVVTACTDAGQEEQA